MTCDMKHQKMALLFGNYQIDTKNAKDLNLIPKDCVDSISCVRFGNDRVAFGSTNMSVVIHTKISEPNPQRFSLKIENVAILGIEWNRWDPRLLMIVTKGKIIVVNSENNTTERELCPPNDSIGFVNGLWYEEGIIGFLDKGAVEIWDNQYELKNKFSIKGSYKCATIDNKVLYIGMERIIKRYNVSEYKIDEIDEIMVTPGCVNRIQITTKWMITSDANGIIAWSKDLLIPEFSLKAKGNDLIAAPNGEIAISVIDGNNVAMSKVEDGKFNELKQVLPISTSAESSKIAADWYVLNENELMCAIAFEKSDEFCYVIIAKITKINKNV